MPNSIKIFYIICSITIGLCSCEDILVEDISNKRVTLIAPSNKAVSADTVQQFTWEHIKTRADYQVQIVHPSFDSIAVLVEDTILAENLLKLHLKKGRQYQWRVRAINNSFTGVYGMPWTITIQ